MKIFTTSQIRTLDRLTIDNEPISSINLMERAAESIFRWFVANYDSCNRVAIFVGPGNNGGDGLALARMLVEVGYCVDVYVMASDSFSADCKINLDRLKSQSIVNPILVNGVNSLPAIKKSTVIVDAIFGTGLTRPLSGFAAQLVDFINSCDADVVSVDIPSGLYGDENPFPNSNSIVEAKYTLSLQFPKLSYFFPENSKYVGHLVVLPIGLLPEAIESTSSPYIYVDHTFSTSLLKHRTKFSHKGSYGHCLIIAGSTGMIGASVLASASCIKTGAGLVTVHSPRVGYSILQQSIPEVMVDIDEDESCFTGIESISKYTAIGIGPGLGKDQKTVTGLRKILKEAKVPLLIDADALNILSENSDLLKLLPQNTVLTPHPGEFDRLFGKSDCGFSRFKVAKEKSKELGVVIVLKGAHTQVFCPDGKIYFNSSGNPGMATGGSGDVLSGVITSLLGQGYKPEVASVLGVYLHGLAGDIASLDIGYNALTASDIIENIGSAFKLIEDEQND